MGAPVHAKDAMITCVTCGLTYSVSQGRDSCARCPLHEDCSTSCCPKCGTSNINPDKSRLARWLQRILTPRLAQGTNAPVVVPAEAQNSSPKIRTSDFGSRPLHSGTKCAEGGGEGVSIFAPIIAPPSAKPVEARQAQAPKARAKQRTLAGVQPGREVQITGYGDLNGSQRQHLQGYGLLPGRRVKVLSQHPVTIVQVEQTELAFERNVASRVLVGD